MARTRHDIEVKKHWTWKLVHLWYIPVLGFTFMFTPLVLLYMGLVSKQPRLLSLFGLALVSMALGIFLFAIEVWQGFATGVLLATWFSIFVYMFASAPNYLRRVALISAGYHPDVPTTAELRETGTVSKRKNIGERFVKDLQKWQNEIDRPAMKEDIQKLIDLSRIILNKKAIDNERFFLRYDKTLNNILGKYDEIENTGLDTEEIRQTMHNVEQNLRKIVIAFQNDVNNLYKSDLVSINAETSAFVQDLHNKGLLDNE